jgi:bifunctional non-homologous end joining protein LigD
MAPAVLDGEIVALTDGQQSFEALQAAMRRQVGVDDVAFLAFDLLWFRGTSQVGVPYADRRARLEAQRFDPPVWLSPRF